jgi:drug/metabolite transporter (DMT)-like permease
MSVTSALIRSTDSTIAPSDHYNGADLSPEHQATPRRAALLMVLAALLFAAMAASVKAASSGLPNAVIVFGRCAFGVAALLPWLAVRPGLSLRTRRFGGHALRAATGLGAMACYFYAIGRLRVADASLLNFSLPLFIPVVARFGLGETFPRRVWRILGMGFCGLILILKPSPGLFQPAAAVGLAAGLLGAVAQVTVRGLTSTESSTRIVFWFGVLSTLLAAGPAAATWRSPSPALWLALAASGLFATVGQLFMTAAYAAAPAAQVGPFLYSTVVFAGVFDWAFWGQLPDAWSLGGALIVALAGALALRWMSPALVRPPVPPGRGP